MTLGLFQPEKTWEAPTQFPRLWDYNGPIAFDVETHDPHLTTRGPSWAWGDGRVVGMGLAWDSGEIYIPLAHRDGGNVASESGGFRYIYDVLRNHKGPKLCFNGEYDFGWSRFMGWTFSGEIVDVARAIPLLDTNRYSYSLDDVAADYLGVGKEEELLVEAAKAQGYDHKN